MQEPQIPHVLTLPVTLPSGNVATIRETNGEDEDIITNVQKAQDLSSINDFLSRIIVSHDFDHLPNKQGVSSQEVEGMLNANRHYLLLKSRILSLGSDLYFNWQCKNKKCMYKPDGLVKEDISEFDQDLSQPIPEKGHPDYNPAKIQKYPQGKATFIEYTTSSGKRVAWDLLTGSGEKKILTLRDKASINSALLVRNFRWYINEQWTIVTSFRDFTSRELTEIRNELTKNDYEFAPIIIIECPKCHTVEEIPLLAIQDFFFPAQT